MNQMISIVVMVGGNTWRKERGRCRGRRAPSNTDQGKFKMSLKHPTVTDARKCSVNKGDMSMSCEGVPTGQT